MEKVYKIAKKIKKVEKRIKSNLSDIDAVNSWIHKTSDDYIELDKINSETDSLKAKRKKLLTRLIAVASNELKEP